LEYVYLMAMYKMIVVQIDQGMDDTLWRDDRISLLLPLSKEAQVPLKSIVKCADRDRHNGRQIVGTDRDRQVMVNMYLTDEGQ
jgi:hypothetical protein